MAAFAVVGVTVLPGTVFADNGHNNGDNTVGVEAERNNDIDQNLQQGEEGCTNELGFGASDDDLFSVGGGNSAAAGQSNQCVVTQATLADNTAGIADFSTNTADVEAIAAEVGVRL